MQLLRLLRTTVRGYKMVLVYYKRIVGAFSSRQAAEQALGRLKRAGFPITQISVMTREIEPDEPQADTKTGFANDEYAALFGYAQERTASGATITGSMLGAIGGCLIGIGITVIPGVAALVAVGTSGIALAATLAGAGVGAVGGGLISALTDAESPRDQDGLYSDRFSNGDYLVMIDGTDKDVRDAEAILSKV